MKTISVQMSEIEYDTYGLLKNRFYFSEIAGIIERQMSRQALRRCVSIAEKNGLSCMTTDEINAEIDAVRQCKR
jgi:hypothetical protein